MVQCITKMITEPITNSANTDAQEWQPTQSTIPKPQYHTQKSTLLQIGLLMQQTLSNDFDTM